ncbi:TetR/AcrR family transcriptional regulator [Clostridium sp. FAM 1755]|uniref:TetR/AcrR family transcriptional regulator n=1 Tax=Clostridium caseinilyticum TaxID=3350403 RepID=UPI0038F78607
MAQQRKTETKAQIKNVFTALLKEKGFDYLTVSDIARGANINRGTFYLHYVDKYDLLKRLEDETINELTKILSHNNDPNHVNDPLGLIPYNSILNALYYVKSDFAFIDALTSNGGDSKFIENFKHILEDIVKAKIDKSENLKFSMKGFPSDYANEILLASITSIILLWIKKGAVESPEYIAKMINKAKQISPYELLF